MSLTRRTFAAACFALPLVSACKSSDSPAATSKHIEIFDPKLSSLIDPQAKWDVLSDGYGWAEGPTWDKKRGQLYFTDVPGNTAYVWKEGVGTNVFLDPSGSSVTDGFREPGANGLLYVDDDYLLLANHGERAVQKLNLADKSRETLVDRFNGLKFNSPNDLVRASNGDIYFSDPPYGLDGLNDSPLKELPHNGVYRLSSDGKIELITDELTFPNGLALSPDDSTLYIAQSDPDMPAVFEIDLASNVEPRVLFNFGPYQDADHSGLPDGFAMTTSGDMFITGPGGVFILSPDGKALGRILTGSATANCAFGEDGTTLFITAHNRLLRIATKATGLSWT